MAFYIEQLYTNCLAEAAYYIESNGEAAIIDPIREIEPYLTLLEKRGVKLKYIFETHFHADFVSGHIDLAVATGATIVFGPHAKTAYQSINATDGQLFQLGDIALKAIHTPGHTPESTCYLLLNEQQQPHALFSGDTLFVGDVGRPDLAIKSNWTQEDLAAMLYDSLRNKIIPLPDNVLLYPAHGAGSSCGKNIGKETFSTLGAQKASNYALQPMSKADFITAVTTGLTPPPAYFFIDAQINQQGYTAFQALMQRVNVPIQLAQVSANALWLDVRKADLFAEKHIKNSVNIGLDGQFAIWAGSVLAYNEPIVVVAENAEKAQEALIRLARVGFENMTGYYLFEPDSAIADGLTLDSIASIEATAAAIKYAEGYPLLDVRKPGEYETAHVDQAYFTTLQLLHDGVSSHIPLDAPFMIHCAGGYRSMIAASLLKRKGYASPINIKGGFGAMQKTNGFPIVQPETVA